MTRLTHLLGTAAVALALTTAAQAQDTATEAPVTDTTEAPATDAPAMDAPAAETAETPAPTADPAAVVATVNGTEITLGQMIIARAQLPAQYNQFPPEVIFQGILDQVVQQQLLADSLTETPDRVTWALENEERSLRAGEVITGLTATAVTDDAVQAAYDELAAAAAEAPVTEWNASHLLVATEEEAQAAKDRITGGEDFAAVATDVSTDPGSANGGELGWFGPGQMVPEFEQTVSTMAPDDLSDPIETQFGWHIVKLNETRERPVPPLEEVQADIVAELQEAAILSRIEELRTNADVTLPDEGAFDPAVLTNLDLLEQ